MSRIKFVLSLITSENDYQREQARSAEIVARRSQIDLEILYADNDSVTQSSQLLDAIHKYKSELTGILVEPAGATGFPQVGKAAVGAGIIWVLLNRDASSLGELRRATSVPAFAVSSDHVEVGRMQARQIAALLPSGGSVLCIHGPAGSAAAVHRMTGLQQAKPANVVLKILKSPNWTEEGGYHAVLSWLRLTTSRQQPIHAVVGQNDLIALGARRAFEELKAEVGGQWSNLPFLGVDGLPKTGQAWVSKGSLTATIVVPPLAGPALEIALDAKLKKLQPAELHLIPAHSFPAMESLRPAAAGKS